MTPIFTKQITIDDAKVRAFAELTGDFNPIHMDEEFAATTEFGHRIAHGLLTTAFISPALVEAFGEGTVYAGQTLKFLKPVLVGDTIEIEFTDHLITPGRRIEQVTTRLYRMVNWVRGEEVVIGQASFIPKHTGDV